MDTFYLVECFWAGVTREVIEAAVERARESALAQCREGFAVAFVGSMLVPADEVVFFQFTAASEEDVIRTARAAGLPFDRVSASLWLEPEAESTTITGASCD
jgi:hypothetical protein